MTLARSTWLPGRSRKVPRREKMASVREGIIITGWVGEKYRSLEKRRRGYAEAALLPERRCYPDDGLHSRRGAAGFMIGERA